MSKTIVSAFDTQQTATRLLASAIASGFDLRFFSLINPAETKEAPLDSLTGIFAGNPRESLLETFANGEFFTHHIGY